MTESSADQPSDRPAHAGPPLAGRHALVTGAGGGIGAAVSIELARLGARVSLLGRRPEPLDRVLAALPGQGHGRVLADVADAGAVDAAVAEATSARGPVSILVNNAGLARSAPAQRTTNALWEQVIAVNLGGTFHCTRAVLDGMRAGRWGRIVNIASTAGLTGYAYVGAYCAAKHGVVGYTRSLALELARDGVTANVVCPGYTDTPLLEDAIRNIVAKTGRSADEARRTLTASNPQGRLVEAPEVARLVGFLCGSGGDAINGQAIAVAGGEVLTG